MRSVILGLGLGLGLCLCLGLGLVLAACGADDSGGAVTTDAGNGGNTDAGGQTCGTIAFSPFNPEASAVAPIRAEITVNAGGVLTYTWQVTHDGATIATQQESSDNSQVSFIAADPGPYYVQVNIGGTFACTYVDGLVNVAAPNANNLVYRLRSVPPSNTGAPPQEQIIQLAGGANIARDITLDPGIAVTGTVRSGSAAGPVAPAYVKFMPVSTPLAFTELFTGTTGQYSTRLLGIAHDVLVIPSSSAFAPTRTSWTTGTSVLVVTPGTVVNGTVKGPSGAALAGAKVQLFGDGVPSTLGTTAANGTYSVRIDFPGNATITVEVTPPAASGLPRLSASGALTLGQPVDIDYAAGIATCNLAGVSVERSSVAQPGAKVTVVGSLAGAAGTVTAGTTVSAFGTVRLAATADGTGKLPSMLVPRSSTLVAVTTLSSSDHALAAIDTTGTCSAITIDAPARVVASAVAKTPTNLTLGGIRIEATPVGDLALAGISPVSTTAASNGSFSLSLAAGGHYDVRYADPRARVAHREDLDVTAAAIPADVLLQPALRMTGHVSIAGSTAALPGTAVQLRCGQCTGIDAARAIAETATDTFSDYALAVPDPGTM